LRRQAASVSIEEPAERNKEGDLKRIRNDFPRQRVALKCMINFAILYSEVVDLSPSVEACRSDVSLIPVFLNQFFNVRHLSSPVKSGQN